MKSKSLLLVTMLLLILLALKYAFAQDENTVGWDFIQEEDPLDSIFGLMMTAPIVGAVFGVLRILFQRYARPILRPISLN